MTSKILPSTEQKDAFREVLFSDYGIEEKYIIEKTLKEGFEQYKVLDEFGTSATLTIDFNNNRYIVECPEFAQEFNIIFYNDSK